MLTTVAATLVSLSALGAALPLQQARSFHGISDFGGHDLDLGDYDHGSDSHISFGHESDISFGHGYGGDDYDSNGYYGYGHGDSFHGFDDFYGHDNFDSSHNVHHVVEEHHVVCHTEKVVIIQQRLAVIHELAKRIITEQICEVETQTVVLEQWRSSIDVFHHDVHHLDGSHPGYDSHIASMYPDLFNGDGSLSTDDLGFSGSDVGSSYVTPSGSNWNDATSPESVQGAFQAAQSANAATSALPPDDSSSADNTAPPADGDNTAPPADGDNTAPPADGDNTAPPADGDNTAAPADPAAAGGIAVNPDDSSTPLAPAAPAPATPAPAKGATPAVAAPGPAKPPVGVTPPKAAPAAPAAPATKA